MYLALKQFIRIFQEQGFVLHFVGDGIAKLKENTLIERNTEINKDIQDVSQDPEANTKTRLPALLLVTQIDSNFRWNSTRPYENAILRSFNAPKKQMDLLWTMP